jgi:hypothetical protein
MRTRNSKLQRGQAMTEFIAAMALFLPLALGVIYIGKFSDVKHQAIQASRYAAMQRAIDPRTRRSDRTIQNETVARFFRDGARYGIARNDTAQGPTTSDSNPLWKQVNGNSIIERYNDINVQFRTSNAGDFALSGLNGGALAFDGLNSRFGIGANVEVPLANVTHFAPLSNLNLKIGATTVVAGDPWSASGSQDVVDHMSLVSVPARIGNFLSQFPGVDQFFELLAGTDAPQIGCVKPDVVPDYAAPGASYDTEDDSGVDECL